jgi:hypothetical protein
MAKEDIVIGIKTQVEGDMGKTLDTLDSKVKDVTKSIDKLGDTEKSAAKSTTTLEVNMKDLRKSIQESITKSTLYVEGLKMLKDAFMSNQVVADALNGVMNALNIIFQQVVGVIIDAVKQTAESTNGFEGLTEVLKSTITIGLAPLKAAFYGIKLAIAEVQLLWEKSPFGSGDTKTIQDLEKTISDTSDSLLQVGKDAIDAGVNIVNNIGKAVDEVGTVVGKSIDGIKKINVAAALEQGKALVNLENNAKIAEAAAARASAKYERQAELLRQIRDDDTKSIDERIAANNDLAAVLDKQEQSLLKGADAQIAAAQARLSVNKTIENQVALTSALAAKDQVLADIEGKRSEQKQNEVNLRKEALAFTELEKSTETELALKRRENATNRIKDDVERLKQQKLDLEETKRIELERLQANIDSTTKGTEARLNAEREYALKKEELDNAILLKEDEINEKIVEKTKERVKKEKEEEQKRRDNAFAVSQEILGGFTQFASAIGQLDQVTTENKLKGVQKGSEAEKKILKESFERQKRLSIVTTLINGAQAIVAALSTPDPTLGILTGIRIAFATATTAIQVAAIQSKQFDAGGGSGGGSAPAPPVSGGGGNISAPSTIGLGQVNMMPQKQQNNWQKVYVVESEIRNTTNKVEVIENRSVLGS